ncbi:MAG: type II toxin-antitoxin system HicB family antitoxin [Thermomicrobiales bacterium]
MEYTQYTVLLQPEEEGGYSVTVPALDGCQTQGETVEEAMEMARDAIAGNLAVRAKHGWDIPKEHPRIIVATVEVAVPPSVVAAAR